MAPTAAPPDLVVPSSWSLDAEPFGMSRGGLHAIDGVQVVIDAGCVVVRDRASNTIPLDPMPEDWTGTPGSWCLYSLAEHGVDLDLGSAQRDLLREALDDAAATVEPVPNFHSWFEEYERSKGRPRRGLVDGGSFAFDVPAEPEPLWGEGNRALHAKGEDMVIAGGQGAGKTTVAQQYALGLAGVPGFGTLLELPVRKLPDEKKVLYLALDRPSQIARSLRRMVTESEHRAILEKRLVVWRGPLPEDVDVVREPRSLARWAVELGAGAVFVDSLKDVAGALSDETVGAAVNAAVQELLAEGVEVVLLHHQRKAQVGNRRPDRLDDVHGSANITRGAGSVVLLRGEPGAEIVQLEHLKQPAEPVGPLTVAHDHATGRSSVLHVPGEGAPLLAGDGRVAERRRQVMARFIRTGAGARLALGDLADVGASEQTLRDDLGALVGGGMLAHEPGGGRGRPGEWWIEPLE